MAFNLLVICHAVPDIRYNKVNHFEFDRVLIFRGISLPETAHFFYGIIGLAIWHILSDIEHIKVNYIR